MPVPKDLSEVTASAQAMCLELVEVPPRMIDCIRGYLHLAFCETATDLVRLSGSCQLQRKILHHRNFENRDKEERKGTNRHNTEVEDQADRESKLELKQMTTKAKKMDETIEYMMGIVRQLNLQEEVQSLPSLILQ